MNLNHISYSTARLDMFQKSVLLFHISSYQYVNFSAAANIKNVFCISGISNLLCFAQIENVHRNKWLEMYLITSVILCLLALEVEELALVLGLHCFHAHQIVR